MPDDEVSFVRPRRCARILMELSWLMAGSLQISYVNYYYYFVFVEKACLVVAYRTKLTRQIIVVVHRVAYKRYQPVLNIARTSSHGNLLFS